MTSPRSMTEGGVRSLGRTALAFSAAVLATAAVLVLVGTLARGAASRSDAERAALAARGETARGAIASAVPARATDPPAPVGAEGALDAFQGALAGACVARGVRLVSFEAAGEPVILASRYASSSSATAPKVPNAVETKVQLRGRIADIYLVIGDLKPCPAPFEVGSLEIESDGAGGVRASLGVAVLVTEGGAVAGR